VEVIGDTGEVARLRILVAPGAGAERLSEPVLVLIEGGKVAAIKSTGERPNAAAAPFLERFVGLPVAVSTPEGPGGKVLRRGRMACQRGAPCSVLFEIDGDRPTYPSAGTIEIESISPAKGTALKAGAQVALKATIRYELVGTEPGHMTLLGSANVERRTFLIPPIRRPVKPGKGVVEFDATFVVPTNSRELVLGIQLTRGSNPSLAFADVVYKIAP
jgi:hypothetical protein